MAYQYQCADAIEPVSDSFGEQSANSAQYNVTGGCAATYSSGDMTKTIAPGGVTHNFVSINVAGNTVTLVSDPSNPRWTWTGINSSGVAVIVSGDPAAIPAVPEIGDLASVSLDLIQTNQTVASNIVTKLDKRVPWPFVSKYKTTTQVFSASTALLDVITANAGTASFWADAAGVYEARYWVPLAFGGTGGAKFQITGPAAPTSVNVTGTRAFTWNHGGDGTEGTLGIIEVTAFASDISSMASAAFGSGSPAYPNDNPAFAEIRLRLVNGSTAGAVTLQAAQNNNNSTTTLGIGFTMDVRRIG